MPNYLLFLFFRPPLPPCDDIKLIKRLDPWGVWLVCKKRELCILNPYRLATIFHTLNYVLIPEYEIKIRTIETFWKPKRD